MAKLTREVNAPQVSSSKARDFRSWLQADIQPPEIEVRFTPSNRHSGQGWECLTPREAELAVADLDMSYCQKLVTRVSGGAFG